VVGRGVGDEVGVFVGEVVGSCVVGFFVGDFFVGLLLTAGLEVGGDRVGFLVPGAVGVPVYGSRTPQSMQSLPYGQMADTLFGPPSSHLPLSFPQHKW